MALLVKSQSFVQGMRLNRSEKMFTPFFFAHLSQQNLTWIISHSDFLFSDNPACNWKANSVCYTYTINTSFGKVVLSLQLLLKLWERHWLNFRATQYDKKKEKKYNNCTMTHDQRNFSITIAVEKSIKIMIMWHLLGCTEKNMFYIPGEQDLLNGASNCL